VDPDEEEAASLEAGGTFAFMFAHGIGLRNSNSDCVWTSWKSISGSYDQAEIFEARELARTGARAVYDAMRAEVEKTSLSADMGNGGQAILGKETTQKADIKSDDDDEMEI
jgi:exosome complex component RRP46